MLWLVAFMWQQQTQSRLDICSFPAGLTSTSKVVGAGEPPSCGSRGSHQLLHMALKRAAVNVLSPSCSSSCCCPSAAQASSRCGSAAAESCMQKEGQRKRRTTSVWGACCAVHA